MDAGEKYPRFCSILALRKTSTTRRRRSGLRDAIAFLRSRSEPHPPQNQQAWKGDVAWPVACGRKDGGDDYGRRCDYDTADDSDGATWASGPLACGCVNAYRWLGIT